MRTIILDAGADRERALRGAAEILRAGGLAAFPTETVYGLGALGLQPAALERIFIAKNRPHSDPLILHVADPAWVTDLVRSLPPAAEQLMAAFWPGPLTLVLPKSGRVPDLVTAGLDSVAVRMPGHSLALELIRRVGEPVAAPSANLFSRPSPTSARHVLEDLDGRIEAVLDGGPADLGVESTVLDLRGDTPVLLRPGGVSREELEKALNGPVTDRGAGESAAGRSPGLLAKHYSPRAEVRLFDGEDAPVIEAMRAAAGDGEASLAILAFTEDLPAFHDLPAILMDLGSRGDLEEVAQTLYATMRELDQQGIFRILARLAPSGGLGEAINDRLLRAAAGRITRAGG
jgi:L-threonylcarbamoyladenylate synthase